jgi:glucose-1-phosphate cytidylyltransferase
LVSSDYFLCTYGDGVSSLNINELVKYHLSGNALATLTAFHPPSRFGEIDIDNNGYVTSFREKQLTASYVNGGFFVFDRSVFDLIDPELSLEEGLLSKLSAESKLRAYLSEDYWQMMDTPREVELLNRQIQQGSAPWLT